jgi:peptidoglycan hydrolase CwlO-like protein
MITIFNPFFGKGEIMLGKSRNSNSDSYKSPARKLVPFFEKSRNKWKAKCQEAKYQVKVLKNKIRYMDKSKEKFKMRVKELENEICQINAKEKQMEQEISELKKNLK